MEALTTLFVIVIAIVGFDLAAIRLGVDSRESIGDDHAR
jgi:hypothetical protein